jgi:putative endonuclease
MSGGVGGAASRDAPLSRSRYALAPRHRAAICTCEQGRLAQLVERLLYTQDVGGSSPSSPTSLRFASYGSASQTLRWKAKRAEAAAPKPRRAKAGRHIPRKGTAIGGAKMTYVYILRSLEHPDRYDVGITRDLRSRLRKHNAGEPAHTSKCAPWALKTYIEFVDEKQAFAFEISQVPVRKGLREKATLRLSVEALLLDPMCPVRVSQAAH